MGVTHKLKQEVVDFIVQTKKDKPKLGVRKLADLTSEKFGIKISKSSVSNVLKEADMSSPVGRRKGEGGRAPSKAKVFQIPEETKQAIRKSVEGSGHPVAPSEQDGKADDVPVDSTKGFDAQDISGQQSVDQPQVADDGDDADDAEEKTKKPDVIKTEALETKQQSIDETAETDIKPDPVSQLNVHDTAQPVDNELPEDDSVPPAVSQEAPSTSDIEQNSEENTEEQPDKHMHILPDPVDDHDEVTDTPVHGEWVGKTADEAYQDFALGHAIQIRAQRQYIISSPLKGFGTIFLHAASRDLSTKPFMGGFLKNTMVSDEILYIDKLSEHEVYQQLWTNFAHIPAEAITDYGYWEFLGFRHPPDTSKFQTLLDTSPPAGKVVLDYFSQKEQAKVKVGHFRLQLRDSSRILIDSNMVSLRKRPAETPVQTLNTAARVLSQRIISNVDPIVLGHIPEDEGALLNFLQMCDNQINKQPISAALLSGRGDDIASFTVVPKIKRKLIAGVYPHQHSFGRYAELLDESEDFRVCYEELSDNLVYYRYCLSELEFDDGRGRFLCKVIGVYENEHKPLKCIILSNMTGKTEQEIIQNYLRKWPDFEEGGINCSKNEQKLPDEPENEEKAFISVDKIDSYKKILLDYGEFLHEFVWKNYFRKEIENDVKLFFRDVYSMFGAVEMTNTNLLVYLMAPKNEKIERLATKAAGIVNERQILDDHGREIYISLVK